MTTSTTDATETGGPPPGTSAEPAPVPGVAASDAPSHRAPRPIPTAVPDEQPEPATTDAGTPPPTQGTEATEAMSITETTGIPTGEDATQPVPVSAPTPSPDPDAAYSGDTLAIPVTPAADGEATVAIPVAAPPSGGPAAPARSYPVATTPPASASATDIATATDTATGAVVAGAAAAASPTPQPQWTSPEDVASAQAVSAGEDGAFPEDALDEPASRTAAHWWGVLIAFTLTPIAWFLLFDGSARIYWSMLADPANVNPAGYLSLGFGLATLAILLLAARKSSVGSIIVGSLATLAGLAFVAIPVQTLEFLSRYADRIESLGGFGRNLYAYTVESGMRSYFLIGGVILIFVGVVSHAARRQGRREERARLALRAAQGENPFV